MARAYADKPGSYANLTRETRCRVCRHRGTAGRGHGRIDYCRKVRRQPGEAPARIDPAMPACRLFRWAR